MNLVKWRMGFGFLRLKFMHLGKPIRLELFKF